MARVISNEGLLVTDGGGGPSCNCVECRRAYLRLPGIKAIERAEALLDRHLSASQRRDWAKHGWIMVKGSHGGRYRLWPTAPYTYSRVVRYTKMGKPVVGLGVWPRGLRIAADWVLAMMLYLQHDEDGVAGLACRGTPEVDY